MPAGAARRVRANRKLRGTGALHVRDGVYVLPDSPEAREVFDDARLELERLEGEGIACLVSWLDDTRARDLDARYRRERHEHRDRIEVELERLRRVATRATRARPAARRTAPARAARLEKRLARLSARHPLAPASIPRANDDSRERLAWIGRIWTTRRGVLVDRIASAWFIRNFVDPDARFRFVAPGEAPRREDIRFDMPGAEFTHEADRCTFEVLVDRFRPGDPGLSAVAEVVHDIDLGDGKFNRPEAAGIGRLVAGLGLVSADDHERLARGEVLFDLLHASFASRLPSPPKGVRP
jgi:hypothetical protein